MSPPLLGSLRARFVFVVGKGGVGKTTTAGALAVGLADAGRRTHLVSTDPAHSLGDLFDQPVEGDAGDPAGTPCGCAPGLVLEEFDAEAYADRWLRGSAGPLEELVERGTYLDAEDVTRFVDLSLPGVDEVMAALRIADLEAGPGERVVVDTAPTGHLLRLIDADAVIRGWGTALSAMAEKARVVASHLVGRSVRFTGEDVLADLEARAARFRDVLAAADFVVVSTPEPMVRAESGRLLSDLERRGLRAAVRVQTGGRADASGVWTVPRRPGERGCDALRELLASAAPPMASVDRPRPPTPPASESARAGVGPSAASGDAVRSAAPCDPAVDGWLAGLPELVLVVGKGGVGKTTCAAACALALARRRSGAAARMALFSTDPAGSLADLFGRPPASDEFEPVPGLVASQLAARAAFDRLRRRFHRDVERVFSGMGLERTAALDREVVESLWNLAPPGIDELMALTSMLELHDRKERLIVDTAPTGHFLRLVEMPGIALEWTHALMRVLLKHRAVAGLEGTAERLLRLARRVKELRRLLTDRDRTAAVLVTLDEPMVRAESARLAAALKRAAIPLDAVVRNRAAAADAASAAVDADARRLRAPKMDEATAGVAALRHFIDQWEMVS